MRKVMFVVLVAVCGAGVFAQQKPRVAVATFGATGVTADEANVVTELFIAELVSTGRLDVIDRANFDTILAEMNFQTSDWSNQQKTAELGGVLNVEYIIRGQFMKMGAVYYWTATMLDIKTAQVMYSAREQLAGMEQIFDKLPTFCKQILDKMPTPNYFVGRWIGLEGSRTCILELKADGSIVVERYETSTIEYRSESGIETRKGTGNYSLINNWISINLLLEKGSSFNVDNSSYKFDASKNGLTLDRGGLLCTYYIYQYVENGWSSYTSFTRIQ